MNLAKRLFFIGFAVFEILTLVLGLDIGSSRRAERDFIIESSQRMEDRVSDVRVKCHGNDWTTFRDFKVTTVKTNITFINCSFAENTSLRRILRSMNISDTLKIQFIGARTSLCRQNFQDLEAKILEFTDTDFTILPFDMLHDLSMERLIISKTNLSQVPKDFFESQSGKLGEVELTGNKLQKIGKQNFTHLFNVWHLNLYENEITEIEARAFDNLPKLSILNLGKNRLRSLPPDIFRHLSRLTVLALGENLFDELSNKLLTSIPGYQLENFQMKYNRGALKTLPDQFFNNLLYLKKVNLESSQLESLPKDLLSNSWQLQSLILRNNSLKSLPLDFFHNSQKLEVLDLSKNQIATLPAGIFANLSGLKDLNISYNNLTSLESDILKGLGELQKLDASHNYLTRVDNGFCRNLPSVQIDSFGAPESGNKSAFEIRGNLHTVNLSTNNATTIFTELAPKLESVDFSFNNLSQFTTGDIEKLRYAKLVDLRNNQISKINLTELASVLATENHDTDISHGPLQIALGNNPLHCDCHLMDFILYWSSSNMKLWQHVKLTSTTDNHAIDGNIICVSPPELKERDVRSIRPEDLSCTVKTDAVDDACTSDCTCHEYQVEKFLYVDCSNKNLTHYPAMISNMYKWPIKLNMSHNLLKHTPTLARPYLANVTSLDLSNNNIETIRMDLFSRNLVDLKFHNNRITRLDETVTQYLMTNNNLRNITLHENPWQCDCEDRRFLQLIQKKNSIHEYKRVVCQKTNQTFYDMSVDDVCKKTIAIIVGASLLVAFIGIATGVGATLYHKYQREIKVWLYSKKWCLWIVTEDELDKDKKYDAFVSFSHKDEDFVENEIVAKLEDGSRPYKLCLHYRDWLAGEWIPVQIRQSVEDSRRTIIVLSSNFLESVWATLEFREAHNQALKEGRPRLIIILYGEIENMDDLDPELKSCLSLKTYLKWGDPWFWDKLRYALPHRRELSRRKTRNTRSIEDHLVRQPTGCNNPEMISMSNLAEGLAKLLDSAVDERTAASC